MSFSVVIPSRNAANLVPCVRAIREAGETCRIIVVDDWIRWGNWRWGNWQFVANALEIEGVKPFVFARNVNLGIKAAGDDDVIVLNDDALLKTKRGFTALSDAAVRFRRDMGIVAASCDTVGNVNQFRQEPKVIDGMEYWAIRDEPRMVCFVCVYIPRSTINAVGLLDERFVDYGMDDDDYCLRVRNAGLKIGIFDGCYVDHGSLRSTYRDDPKNGGNFLPNLTRFIAKWGVDNRGKGYAESEWKHVWPKELIP